MKKKWSAWMPEAKSEPYNIRAVKVSSNGDCEETTVLVGKNGLVKDESDVLILPDYARDVSILKEDRNNDLLNFCKECVNRNRSVLVLCSRVAQVFYLLGFFKKQKCQFKTQCLCGLDSLEKRNNLKRSFSSGEFDVLLASSIFDEGEDVPNVGAVALAGEGSSMVRQVQRIGRGVRKKNKSSNWCPVWFPVDTYHSFGKEQSLHRLEYLGLSQVSSYEVTKDWSSTMNELEELYGRH
jgi:superfamily II DNA or RNA helicase